MSLHKAQAISRHSINTEVVAITVGLLNPLLLLFSYEKPLTQVSFFVWQIACFDDVDEFFKSYTECYLKWFCCCPSFNLIDMICSFVRSFVRNKKFQWNMFSSSTCMFMHTSRWTVVFSTNGSSLFGEKAITNDHHVHRFS